MSDFKAGQLIIYQNGDSFEIGRIKRIKDEGGKAFVWYHSGETAACTDFSDMHPIRNENLIILDALGGINNIADEAREVTTELRMVANEYERIGCDRLQRETMRRAANLIEKLMGWRA